jgi:hypothetical protein
VTRGHKTLRVCHQTSHPGLGGAVLVASTSTTRGAGAASRTAAVRFWHAVERRKLLCVRRGGHGWRHHGRVSKSLRLWGVRVCLRTLLLLLLHGVLLLLHGVLLLLLLERAVLLLLLPLLLLGERVMYHFRVGCGGGTAARR